MEQQLFLQVADHLCLAITKESDPPHSYNAFLKVNSLILTLRVSPAGSVCFHFIWVSLQWIVNSRDVN
jgi:hypothetical protein